MGLVKVAVTDTAISFLWALYIAFMRPVSAMLASSFSLLQGKEFYIILALLALNIFVFSLLGRALGGAFWNPTALLAFYCVGTTKDSLFSLAVRWPAQAAGAVGGVFAAKELFVPTVYKHLLGGPRLMVDFNRGVLAELFLTFLMTFSVLVAVFRGPSNAFLKTWMIILATYAVILLGAGYTGPSLNPAHAFAWAYLDDRHYNSDHLFVFWLAPLAGSMLAAWTFNLGFARKVPKEKSA